MARPREQRVSFRIRKKLSPISPPEVQVASLLDECSTFLASGVDAEFPSVNLSHIAPPTFRAASLSPDLTQIRINTGEYALLTRADHHAVQMLSPPEVLDEIDLPSLWVDILPNVFQPLTPARTDGKVYARVRTGEEDDGQGRLFESSERRNGRRKSFREVRTAKGTLVRNVMTIWDRILPILQPPIRFDLPEFFELPARLYPFQIDGVKFLGERESALLGDDMGTGKTVQSSVALRLLFQNGTVKSALIVCPLSVLGNWDYELQRWAPHLSVTVVRGLRPSRESEWRYVAHVWLTTYDTLREDVDFLEENGWIDKFDVVVADEIQKIKNPSSRVSQAIKRLRPKLRWGLSGTPIENRLEDLYSIFQFIKPGLLRLQAITPEAASRLIEPYFLRRRKKDVLQDLPEKQVRHVWLQLEGKQWEAYERAEREGIVELNNLGVRITVTHVLELLTRLKQLCNFEPTTGESAKWEWLKDVIEEIVEKREKTLVFSQYLERGIDWIEKKLGTEGIQLIKFSSNLSDLQRRRAEHDFNHDPNISFFVATPKTGGTGLNLQAANHVVHFDHWWNPATATQAEDRAHRIGQTKDVFVYRLWALGTVEERICKILERKQALYDTVIDRLAVVEETGLSEEDLFGLFSLKPPRATGKVGDFSTLTPQQFEEKVAALYEKWGYGVRVTGSPRDQGVDVIATRSLPGGIEKLAIQCKLQKHPVGVDVARELLGVLEKDSSFTRGVIASSADFSQDCRDFVEGMGRIELLDGGTVLKQMKDYGVIA